MAGAGAGLGRRHEEGEKGLSDRELGKADLHVHTALGDGMASPREILEYVETHTDLDVIAITDHDSLRGAWETRELWAQGSYRFQVVMGMEVTALEGHLLALFIEEPLPSLRPAEEIIAAIHRQGGLCIVPTPLAGLPAAWGGGPWSASWPPVERASTWMAWRRPTPPRGRSPGSARRGS